MKTNMIFKEGDRITQEYGADPDYYKRNHGHEGLDVCPPADGIDWTIHNIYKGEVKEKGFHDEYGNFVKIWHKDINLVSMHCHLQDIYVDVDDKLAMGDPIGKMGNTGNSNGAHNHFMVIPVDDYYNRTTKKSSKNMMNGRIDPWPILQLCQEIKELKRA